MAKRPLRQLLNIVYGCIKGSNHARALRLLITNLPRTGFNALLRRAVAAVLLDLGHSQAGLAVLDALARHLANAGQPLLALAVTKQILGITSDFSGHLDHIASIYAASSPLLAPGPIPSLLDAPTPAGAPALDLSGAEPDESLDVLCDIARGMAMRSEGLVTTPDALPPIPLLSLLEPQTLRAVLDQLTVASFGPDTALLTAQKTPSTLGWLAHGDLRVTLPEGLSGRVPSGALLHPSALLGTPTPSHVTATTYGQTELLMLPPSSLPNLREHVTALRDAATRFDLASRVLQVLHNSPALVSLPDTERTEVLRYMDAHVLEDQTTLIHQGHTGTGIYIIVKGLIDIRRHRIDGGIDQLDPLGPGDVLGEIGVVTEGAATASAVTRGTTHVLYIDRSRYQAFAHSYPSVHDTLCEAAAQRLLSDTKYAAPDAV